MTFNYGCDEKDIGKKTSSIKLWPTTGRRTALVDADAIAYVIGYTSDLQQYLKAKRSKDFFSTRVWEDKKEHANFLINKWVQNAECDSALLYLTDSTNNFRNAIATVKPYKGQRTEEKPPFFYEIREWLLDYHNAIMSVRCEADDSISIEAWSRIVKVDKDILWTMMHRSVSDFVVVSGDKDLGMIPTWRCQPTGKLEWIDPLGYLEPEWKEKEIVAYEYWPLFNKGTKDLSKCYTSSKYKGSLIVREKEDLEVPKIKWEMDYVWFHKGKRQDIFTRGLKAGKGKFKRVKVGTKKSEYLHKLRGGGLKFFYVQILTGDQVDNYPGLPGCGDTCAYETLDDAINEQELVSRVRQLYFNHYGEAADERMLEQGQLAWMQTHKGEIWNLPSSNSQSFPV